VEAHGGKRSDLSIFGQEQPHDLEARQDEPGDPGIEANLGTLNATASTYGLHRTLKADYIWPTRRST